MKKIIAVLVLMGLIFAGCAEATADANDTDKKPTSCAISDDATDNGGDDTATTNFNPANGQEALEMAMKAIKAVDKEGISYYFGEDFWQGWFDVGNEELALIKKAFPKMEYEFLSFEENDTGSTFGTLKTTVIDLRAQYWNVEQRLDTWMQERNYEYTEEEKRAELFAIFNDELKDGLAKRITVEVTIEAYCTEGKWWVSRSDDFVRAIFGQGDYGMGM